LTAASFFSEDLGIRLESATLDTLGVGHDARGSSGRPQPSSMVEGRRRTSKRASTGPSRDRAHHIAFGCENLQERPAKLAGGVAIIRVGGATEVEVKERKDRVDDAVHPPTQRSRKVLLPEAAQRCFFLRRLLIDSTRATETSR
jgi:chaperonin GroEL